MTYSITTIDGSLWRELSEKAHLTVFGETGRELLERADFAILALGNEELGGYMAVKEMDASTLYIQYGGVFPLFEKSVHVVRGYKLMLDWCKKEYANVWTRIENTNSSMLKMALSMGFIVTGTSFFKNKLFLELTLEKES